MLESKNYYFYLWRHRYVDDATDNIVTRTCFGITDSPHNRRNGYEGHVGHSVKFLHVWIGPERVIRELEARVKDDFHDYRVIGYRNFRYEWINEEVEYNDVYGYVKWEVENTFSTIQPIVIEDL